MTHFADHATLNTHTRHLARRRMDTITTVDVNVCLDRAVAAGLARGTVRNLLASLRTVFRRAVRDGLVSDDPTELASLPDMPKTTRKRRAVLTDEEFRQWQERGQDPRLRLMGAVSRMFGGCRTGDLVALRWESLDPGSFLTGWAPRAKTQTPQQLAIPLALRSLLRAWWYRHGSPTSGPVFPGLGRRSWARELRRDLLLAGVTRDELHHETAYTLPVDFHSFRRAYCQALARAGLSAQVAQALAGHSDAGVHQRYVAGLAVEVPAGALPL